MARHILKCPKCEEYTMEDVCKRCGEKTLLVRPPKYSPQDKLAKYRRKIKYESE